MKTPSFFMIPLLALATACAVATEGPGAPEEQAAQDQADLSVYDDDLNGLWLASIDGVQSQSPSVIESWPAVGIRLTTGWCALARPGATDAAGRPVAGQVVVGKQLRPGDPSYADVLNHGNDMQEYADMAALKQLATGYLREKRPSHVAAVEAAFAGVIPPSELPWAAKQDIFHFVTAQLYDAKGRTANLKGPAADAAIDAVSALLDVLRQDSAAFEAYVLAKGYAKSNEPAPRSSGFQSVSARAQSHRRSGESRQDARRTPSSPGGDPDPETRERRRL